MPLAVPRARSPTCPSVPARRQDGDGPGLAVSSAKQVDRRRPRQQVGAGDTETPAISRASRRRWRTVRRTSPCAWIGSSPRRRRDFGATAPGSVGRALSSARTTDCRAGRRSVRARRSARQVDVAATNLRPRRRRRTPARRCSCRSARHRRRKPLRGSRSRCCCSMAMPRWRSGASSVSGRACSQITRSGSRTCAATCGHLRVEPVLVVAERQAWRRARPSRA